MEKFDITVDITTDAWYNIEVSMLAAGDWLRISPAAKRQFFASEDVAISFACIQVKENSLEGYTKEDAVI